MYDYIHYNRQEKLERLAERFEKKASLRETWLNEMMKVKQSKYCAFIGIVICDLMKVVTNLETQTDLKAVESAFKRHETVSVEIGAGVSQLHVSS